MIFEPAKLIIAVIVSIVLFLIVYIKKRQYPRKPDEIKQVIVDHFKRRNWEYKELNHGMFIVKKNIKKILFYVDSKVNFDILKEILYEAFWNSVRDIRIVSLEGTGDVFEAIRKINSNIKTHKTKIVFKRLGEFKDVIR